MTTKGAMNDFYNQFEEISKKLDKANDTIRNMALDISMLRKDLQKERKSHDKDRKKIEELLLEIERLKNNKKKDSNNSSKPSSTNGFKKVNNNREKSDKKCGGQVGHKGSTLTKEDIDKMISNGEIDEIIEVEENKTEDNKNLVPIITYEYDIEIKRKVIKHITYPKKPTNILKSPVSYGNNLKVICNILGMKYIFIDGIKAFISEITNHKINLSKGTIYAWKEDISNKLNKSEYKKIQDILLNSLVLHVDETTIKINGEQYYIHSISNDTHTLQYVNKKRGEDAIKEFGFLENYQGILVHDHFMMYYSYGIDNAECNVHILRYLNGVCEFTNHTWSKQMKELLLEAKARKEELISLEKDSINENEYNDYKKRYLALIRLGKNEYKQDYKTNAYKDEEIRLLNRMEKYIHNHLLFLEKFYVPFSNNRAEADVRHVKIVQKIGKFRSIDGAINYVITRSCYSTYQKNRVSIFDSLKSLLNGEPTLI